MASIELVVLRCADVAVTRSFYELLGIAFRHERHGDGPAHVAATLDDGAVLELYPATDARPPEAGLRLGFRVDGLERAVARLESAGHPRRREGVATFVDPDGRLVVATHTGPVGSTEGP